jgi:hypothetical protein
MKIKATVQAQPCHAEGFSAEFFTNIHFKTDIDFPKKEFTNTKRNNSRKITIDFKYGTENNTFTQLHVSSSKQMTKELNLFKLCP